MRYRIGIDPGERFIGIAVVGIDDWERKRALRSDSNNPPALLNARRPKGHRLARYEYRTARRESSQVRGRSSRWDRCSTLLTRSLTAPQ